MGDAKRPSVKIKFKYNKDTGEIEEFIIDDNARELSEEYHDKVARAISSCLGSNPEIIDTGRLPGGIRTIGDKGETDENWIKKTEEGLK